MDSGVHEKLLRTSRPSLLRADRTGHLKMEAVHKSKMSKSRNGCLTCKKKRLKCDETKPYCLKCSTKKLKCGGYATNFKWKSDYSAAPMARSKYVALAHLELNSHCAQTPSVPPAGLPTTGGLQRHLELASLSVTGKSIAEIKIENDLIALGYNPNAHTLSDSVKPQPKRRFSNETTHVRHRDPTKRPRSRSATCLSEAELKRHDIKMVATNNLASLAGVAVEEMRNNISDSPSAIVNGTRVPSQHQTHNVFTQSLGGPFSPGFAEFLSSHQVLSSLSPDEAMQRVPAVSQTPSPTIREDLQLATTMRDASPLYDDAKLTPSLSALINYAFTNGNIGDETRFSNVLITPKSPLGCEKLDVDLAVIDKTQAIDRRLGVIMQAIEVSPQVRTSRETPPTINAEINQVLTMSAEMDQILFLYSQYTCLIMSIKNGAEENPWRTLILPFAKIYRCLFNSMAAMTVFHLAGSNSEKSHALRSRGYIYMKRCILELASGLTKMNEKPAVNALPADIALTTCINLAVCECWDRHTSSGIAHLKGAKSMVQMVMSVLRHQQSADLKRYHQLKCNERPAEFDDLKERLVTVDTREWGEIIRENSAKMDDTHFDVNRLSITIPRSLQFLFNAWIYFEVLAQMTTDFNQDDKGIDLVATITKIADNSHRKTQLKRSTSATSSTQFFSSKTSTSDMRSERSPSDRLDSSALSVHEPIFAHNKAKALSIFDRFESFTFTNDDIDPLLGCAQSLFLIMGKVAVLISKIRRTHWEMGKELLEKARPFRNSLADITTATQLKQQLIDWKPTLSSAMMGMNYEGASAPSQGDARAATTWEISSCIASAEAYRYSTLLYLHQSVPEIPSMSSAQLADKVFVLLASVPMTSNIYIVHIFPLLVSSCEARPGDEREWCLSRWEALAEKMWIGNIDKALEVVKEVWRRKDEFETSRVKSKEDRLSFNVAGDGDGAVKLIEINGQLSGLMAAINQNSEKKSDDHRGGINSRFHWSTVMKEWGWEILLA